MWITKGQITFRDPVAKFTIVIKLRIDNLNRLIWNIFIHVVNHNCKGSPLCFFFFYLMEKLGKKEKEKKKEATNIVPQVMYRFV